MGHHYVPREYLRGFAPTDAPEMIWLHDKNGGSPRRLPIAAVAQSDGFYDAAVEKALNEDIEGPATPALQALRAGEAISVADRFRLALYIGVMLKRVPYQRAEALTFVPDAVRETAEEARSELVAVASKIGADPRIVSKRLAEIDAFEERHRDDPPDSIHEQIRSPWPTEAMVRAVFSMTWRVLQARGPDWFITSDNPAYFHKAYGLATAEAELVFPLSSKLALHGCWQHDTNADADARLSFIQAEPAMIREMNRRVASTATRFAFYHEPADWLPRLLRKGHDPRRLSRVRWTKPRPRRLRKTG